MPEPTPPDPVEPMRRQIARLRRRRNLYEVERTLSLLVATAGAAATAIVLLALGARPMFFAAGVASVGSRRSSARASPSPARGGAGSAASGPRSGSIAGGPRGPPGDADRAPAPRYPAGRIVLPPAAPRGEPRRLPSWRPAAVVPRAVPRGAVAAALGTTIALLLVLLAHPGSADCARGVYGEAVPEGGGRCAPFPAACSSHPRGTRSGSRRRQRRRSSRSSRAHPASGVGHEWEATREAMARMAGEQQARARERAPIHAGPGRRRGHRAGLGPRAPRPVPR